MPRNPKSLANLTKSKRRQGKGDRIAKSITVPQSAIDLAAALGDSNVSKGFSRMAQDRLFAQSPVFARAKAFVEAIAQPDFVWTQTAAETAEALLYDLQSLEIEKVYEEAVLDGAIELSSGAWIV